MTGEEQMSIEEEMATAMIWVARERSKDGMTGISEPRARALAHVALQVAERRLREADVPDATISRPPADQRSFWRWLSDAFLAALFIKRKRQS